MTAADADTPVDTEAVRSILCDHPVEFAVLFGSAARGESHAESDVDIGVVFESFRTVRAYRTAREELTADLMSAMGRNEIDLIDLDDAEPSVARHALSDAVVLLGDPARLSDLRDRYRVDGNESEFQTRLDRALERAGS